MDGRNVWKLVGLAGVVGVAATGALAARAERKRRAYTPTRSGPSCTPASRRPPPRPTSHGWI
ncbi:hypothetical protein BTZ20_2496 [Rhodococcus sp. MTM3W5.2]|nr:hypothetical protein BTZ20_2496 [Rhodococcus sp. MTM3W5.2]